MGAPVDYPDPYDDKQRPDPGWTDIVGNAAREFAGNLKESSDQLASAAEHFARESM